MPIGYKLCSEEHGPLDLVRFARRAEEVGFTFGAISDHYHPWTDEQGHSPFVWGMLGALAQATKRLELMTFVTCPTIRIHPAIIAQAAATAGCLLPGRFVLGVGSGENLNEHILGDAWPPTSIRHEMLEEAVEVIRLLWEGGQASHHGGYYVVENARVYDLPHPLPPIFVAAGGPKAADLAGRIGDGLITTSPDEEVLKGFRAAGGQGKPTVTEVTVCYHQDEEEAVKIAHQKWALAAITGELNQELPNPKHFEQASQMVRPEDVAKSVVCGADPKRHLEKLQEALDAGIEYLCVHQVGPQQEEFLDFYAREVLPKLGKATAPAPLVKR